MIPIYVLDGWEPVVWLKQELRRKDREGPEGGLDVSGLSGVPSSGKNEPADTKVCLGIQI